MPRKLRIAAVQMDATPAPVPGRLERAAGLTAEAASAGAQLIVLPELFNTGYEYSDHNYTLAEAADGQTMTWMKQQAIEHKIHLAGTLMLLDEEDVYNAALLVAPDGHTWRYDKHYPLLWERAYFHEGHTITVAKTDLGRLGMMICWDSAHAELWERYAGKVDAMLVMSCPPKLSSADLVFPDGTRIGTRELGPLGETLYTKEEYFPGPDLDDRAAWMRVPVVHAQGAGQFRSALPMPQASVAAYLVNRPDLWNKAVEAHAARIEAGFDKQTKILDATGRALARVTDDGDGFALADVELADDLPQPAYDQPKMRTPRLAYFLADVFGAGMMTMAYRRGVRRQWGARMAPPDPRTRIWTGVVLGALGVGWLLGKSGRGGRFFARR